MSTTLVAAEARDAIHACIDRLSPESVGHWGTMSTHERRLMAHARATGAKMRVYLPAAVAVASTSPTACTMSCWGPMPV